LFIFLALLGAHVLAQENPPPPRIGLALSGGGAKGFAHMGAPTIIGPVEITLMGGSRHRLLANFNIGYKF